MLSGTWFQSHILRRRADDGGGAMAAVKTGEELRVAKSPEEPGIEASGVTSAKKVTEGGLVVRNHDGNNAPRKMITLKLKNPEANSEILLKCASDKVKIYDASTGGTQIQLDGNSNKFKKNNLPKSLWVEGVKHSDTMRDVEIVIEVVGAPAKKDTIKLTVLWVDKPDVSTSGTVSANNAKRDNYKNWTEATTYDLGLQKYNNYMGKRIGWGTEASAKVRPSSFEYSRYDLKLERDYDYKDYFDNDKDKQEGLASATIPPGNDTGPTAARDDNPHPDDKIYDFDAAGLSRPVADKDKIRRTRNNFKAFASITVEGKAVRCSEVREYYIRFSQKQHKDPSGDDWKVIDPADVTNDKQAGYGTTKLTWDLK